MNICLGVFLLNGVVNDLNYSSRLLIQAREYFSPPALIVLIVFCSTFLLTSTVLIAICSILLVAIFQLFWSPLAQLFGSCLVQLFRSQLYSFLTHFC